MSHCARANAFAARRAGVDRQATRGERRGARRETTSRAERARAAAEKEGKGQPNAWRGQRHERGRGGRGSIAGASRRPLSGRPTSAVGVDRSIDLSHVRARAHNLSLLQGVVKMESSIFFCRVSGLSRVHPRSGPRVCACVRRTKAWARRRRRPVACSLTRSLSRSLSRRRPRALSPSRRSRAPVVSRRRRRAARRGDDRRETTTRTKPDDARFCQRRRPGGTPSRGGAPCGSRRSTRRGRRTRGGCLFGSPDGAVETVTSRLLCVVPI